VNEPKLLSRPEHTEIAVRFMSSLRVGLQFFLLKLYFPRGIRRRRVAFARLARRLVTTTKLLVGEFAVAVTVGDTRRSCNRANRYCVVLMSP
jgi:hypothetical protein